MNTQQLVERLTAKRRKPAPEGPCTALTERCGNARDYQTELRPCCRGHLVGLVARTAAALNTLGVTWWADYGTLLGAVRNPLTTWADYHWLPQADRPAGPLVAGILPHDKDADLGVERNAWDLVRMNLPQLMDGARVAVFHHGRSLKVMLSAQNKTNVDLFFWHERPDGMLAREGYAGVDDFKGREFDRDLLYPLSSLTWEGLTLPAPRDAAAFCEMRYGAGWRTPIPANNDGQRR